MKRENTAHPEMIKEVNELRKNGVKEFYCTTIVNINGKDKWYTPVEKHTAQGISSYANSMFRKYGDATTVEVTYFDDNWKEHTLTTYSA